MPLISEGGPHDSESRSRASKDSLSLEERWERVEWEKCQQVKGASVLPQASAAKEDGETSKKDMLDDVIAAVDGDIVSSIFESLAQ
jgi:hypothetical protein